MQGESRSPLEAELLMSLTWRELCETHISMLQGAIWPVLSLHSWGAALLAPSADSALESAVVHSIAHDGGKPRPPDPKASPR